MNKTRIVRSKELLHSEKIKGGGFSSGGTVLGFLKSILQSILKSVDLKHIAVLL